MSAGSPRFDVTTNEADYSRRLAPVVWALRAAGPILLGLALWSWTLSGFESTVHYILFAFLLALSALAAFGAWTTFLPAISTMEIRPAGLLLLTANGRTQDWAWPKLRKPIRLCDYRGTRSVFASIPCTIDLKYRSHGVSGPAADAILASARDFGLNVTSPAKTGSQGPAAIWDIAPRQ